MPDKHAHFISWNPMYHIGFQDKIVVCLDPQFQICQGLQEFT